MTGTWFPGCSDCVLNAYREAQLTVSQLTRPRARSDDAHRYKVTRSPDAADLSMAAMSSWRRPFLCQRGGDVKLGGLVPTVSSMDGQGKDLRQCGVSGDPQGSVGSVDLPLEPATAGHCLTDVDTGSRPGRVSYARGDRQSSRLPRAVSRIHQSGHDRGLVIGGTAPLLPRALAPRRCRWASSLAGSRARCPAAAIRRVPRHSARGVESRAISGLRRISRCYLRSEPGAQ